MNSQRKINKLDIRRLVGVHPLLTIVFFEAQKTAPYEIRIGYLGGRRTTQEQYSLFKKKKSTKDGTKKKSKHQLGKAIDFVVYINGEANWDIEKYDEVAKHIQKTALNLFNIKLRGGWDWNMNNIPVRKDPKEKFQDAGHLEML